MALAGAAVDPSPSLSPFAWAFVRAPPPSPVLLLIVVNLPLLVVPDALLRQPDPLQQPVDDRLPRRPRVDVVEVAEVVGGRDEVDEDVGGGLTGGVEGVAVDQGVEAGSKLRRFTPLVLGFVSVVVPIAMCASLAPRANLSSPLSPSSQSLRATCRRKPPPCTSAGCSFP